MATNRSKVGTSTESLMNSTPFVGGLNTELSGIIDSTEFTKDELNMMIRPDGTRSRRPGVDYEEMYSFGEQAYADISDPKWAFEAIEWYDVTGPDEAVGYDGQPYIVVQNGTALQFFLNKGQPYSGNESEFALDLTQYKLPGKSDKDVGEARCKFASAYGSLFVCSDAIQPIQLRSAQSQQQSTPTPQSTSASVRISTRVGNAHSSRWRSIYSGSPYHPERGFWIDFYLNGILIKTETCTNWYGSPYTSDTGGPWFWCSTQIASMWNSIDSATRLGITATPKYADAVPTRLGIHDNTTNTNIENSYDSSGVDDWVNFVAPVSTGFDYRGYTIELRCYAWGKKLGSYAWTQKGTFSGGTAYTQETGYSLMIRDTSVGAKDYLGIQSSPSKMSYAHLYNLYNQGWTNKLLAKYYTCSEPSISGTFPANNLAQQYLKDDKTTAFKPEALLNTTFGNTPAARGHVILNYFNQKRRTTANVVTGMVDLVQSINDLGVSVTFDSIRDKLGSTAATEEAIAAEQVPNYKTTYQNVTDIIHYAGRLFYLVGDTLLYSQMISEDTTKAGYCYTEADPTSEEISDVVETDGGLISLPDIGEGVKLAQVGQYLLVFGTRGNVAITGTANNIFTATAYSAGSLNAVPSQAPQSFVNTEFGLLYWGTTGITFIANANDGLAVQDLSTPKILTWYGKLNNTQHKYCKGIYSSSKKKVYWFYPSDEYNPRRLDRCLVYDIQRNSFAPQAITSTTVDPDSGDLMDLPVPMVVSGLSLKTPFRSDKEYPVIAEVDGVQQEVGTDAYKDLLFTFDGYKDANYLVNYDMYFGRVLSSRGVLFRCKLSSLMSLTDVVEHRLLTYRNGYNWNSLAHVNVTRSGSDFTIIYYIGNDPAATGVSYGPYSSTDTLWFADFDDWHISGSERTYFGFCAESELSGSGYTAQTLPDEAIPFLRKQYISAYTEETIIHEFYNVSVGDFETGIGRFTIDNANNTFTSQSEADYSMFVSKDNYFMKDGSDNIYRKEDDDHMVAVGVKRMDYTAVFEGTYDFISNESNKMTYLAFRGRYGSGGGLLPDLEPIQTYYVSLKDSGYPHAPVFYYDGTTFICCGFTMDVPTNSGGISFRRYRPDYIPGVRLSCWRSQEDDMSKQKTITVITRYDAIDTVKKETIHLGYWNILADDPIDSEAFTYESSILVCLDIHNSKITFGDFRNNNMRDWTAGDWQGPGYIFDSYLISHPMNANGYSQFSGNRKSDIVHSKNMPYLLSYFRRTETGPLIGGGYVYPSACQGSILWDWRTSGRAGKWSSPTDLYRPHKDTIFDNGFIVNKTNIRGLGRAYQVKLESVEDNQFILEGLVFDLKNDGRI